MPVFRERSGAILLGIVECRSLEEQLDLCSHNGIGVLGHHEDVCFICALGIWQLELKETAQSKCSIW